MTKNQTISKILQKPMNRQEFLQHSAAAVLFVVGGGAIVQAMAKSFTAGERVSLSNDPAKSTRSSGYGASAYGGHKTVG